MEMELCAETRFSLLHVTTSRLLALVARKKHFDIFMTTTRNCTCDLLLCHRMPISHKTCDRKSAGFVAKMFVDVKHDTYAFKTDCAY